MEFLVPGKSCTSRTSGSCFSVSLTSHACCLSSCGSDTTSSKQRYCGDVFLHGCQCLLSGSSCLSCSVIIAWCKIDALN